jgi:hypothetical protein
MEINLIADGWRIIVCKEKNSQNKEKKTSTVIYCGVISAQFIEIVNL